MVKPGSRVQLAKLDPATTHGHDKARADEDLRKGLQRLTNLQDRVWAEQKHPVLVVLQGIDAAGKDGTIRHVMSAFNPQGCPVTSFKAPTPIELAHDYLWRAHQRTPAKGEIAIFNRSYYEDVLVVRVHNFVPKTVWSRRYDQINAWERTLVEERTTIVKFFLNISADEQRQRFQERVRSASPRPPFEVEQLGSHLGAQIHGLDLRDEMSPQMFAAFEAALERCSTDLAPWYVIPANRNWFRNLAVAEILGDVLAGLKPAYPPSSDPIPAGFKVT